MKLKPKATLCTLVAAAFLSSCASKGDETATVETKPVLFVPDDLEVTIWAESPQFFNPTNIDVDVSAVSG